MAVSSEEHVAVIISQY